MWGHSAPHPSKLQFSHALKRDKLGNPDADEGEKWAIVIDALGLSWRGENAAKAQAAVSRGRFRTFFWAGLVPPSLR